jgi:hypothetical protein
MRCRSFAASLTMRTVTAQHQAPAERLWNPRAIRRERRRGSTRQRAAMPPSVVVPTRSVSLTPPVRGRCAEEEL